MSRRILRSRLKLSPEPQTVRAPAGRVLDVEIAPLGVGYQPTLMVDVWIEGDDETLTTRVFQILGAGAVVPAGTWHVGSTVRRDGFKWHVYELPYELPGEVS